MHRRKFIKNTCIACIAGFSILELLDSCGTSNQITTPLVGENMFVNLSEFYSISNNKKVEKNYIVVHNDVLQYPICVYKIGDEKYTALLLKCTHQGAELQVFGAKIQCPAHGAEFSNTGLVENGPATQNLRSFPVSIVNNQLKINLK